MERFQTARLLAERLGAEDFEALRRLLQEARVAATLDGPLPDERTRQYLDAGLEHQARYDFGR
ncbi:hypothetical protein [Vitiosangium sp. GDMCC 1.1324]|uniref:hypothetical protein n=1 Tax=Vitiosangium sp. (strain GDMCC 1.1324) TaxID=2138576 RepID=UPI000D365B3A|nr:hypothetical protein [Vitiosangium sp. GDMCC 1.1324]PTL84722.1 hypothetical protein DAT35_06550 [Vitiosangium sp. GDMCC 1.1324]